MLSTSLSLSSSLSTFLQNTLGYKHVHDIIIILVYTPTEAGLGSFSQKIDSANPAQLS